jgi:oligopeptide/dipeptide ABC transporter ATP-binding protein
MAYSPLLSLSQLHVEFRTGHDRVYAVNGVDLALRSGEHLGIAGESGSGKSVTCTALTGIAPSTATVSGTLRAGAALTGDTQRHIDLAGATDADFRGLRGSAVGYVFQDARSYMDPYLAIGRQLEQLAGIHGVARTERNELAAEWLERVGISDARRRMGALPHELSGGMCQRVGIAMALIPNPTVLVADEPSSDLDVSTQVLLIELLQRLTSEQGLTMLLVSHNLGVVSRVCSRIAVMYGGLIVEEGSSSEILDDGLHPYTRGLLESVPSLTGPPRIPLGIRGNAAVRHEPLHTCPFVDRCDLRVPACYEEVPALTSAGGTRRLRCPVVNPYGREFL